MSSLPIDIFISYAASDQESKEELEQYLDKLQQSGLIRFSSHQIPTDVDDEWGEQAHSDLDRFKIVLLLVSSYYISSEYFWDTFLPRIMQEHESSRVRIIPIILRPVDWLSAEFAKLQALPRFGKPIDRWENPSEAFEDVINGIQRVIEDLIESNSPARNPELPVKIFFSCAWKDLDEQAELQRHLILLERQGLVSFWHAGCISAGTEHDIEIQNQLNAADIIIMLLSKHYLNSDYCFNNEFQRALERQRSENIRIVPILLENLVAIDQLLGKIPALPKNSKPINEWENKNEAFNNVASDIEGIVADFYKIPVKIYISYSHKDKAILNELQKYLSILVEKGIVTIWEDHIAVLNDS
ncbi:toll/interleukin-1 receptor domain-containing protein [Leptolyngbya boryana CZ1]|uniref:Toll/interleukin-1 receptor domain-containing protein n=1 Tax=Leptolyngbya boryana CZ1 TaxID=3060204 RepID=A0AA97AXK8_LEPBY|nr:toll/interleukin-1 receptor domain-containing protein [Leptolyngbya boryana]WNZ47471.1 toll/interleukin-1 receptor domain-containing protein [Leptolyngbya boryana CZ1]